MKFIPMLFDMGINSIITGYATAPIFSLELRKTSAQQSTYLYLCQRSDCGGLNLWWCHLVIYSEARSSLLYAVRNDYGPRIHQAHRITHKN